MTCLALCGTQDVQAKEKVVGVRAWTSGSQTYIRIRPDVSTPPVAKVPAHTELFVWGKKNGWYRVETPDHTFGWVYFDYIKSPDIKKVRELSNAKAAAASARTAHQTMYGSPELLKTYYAKYGDSGAQKGLQKHGIELASARKAKAARPVAQVSAAAAEPTQLVSTRPPVAPVAVTPLQRAARLALLSGPEQPSRKSVAGQDMSLTSRSLGREHAAMRVRKDGFTPALAAQVPLQTALAPQAPATLSEQVQPESLPQGSVPVKVVVPVATVPVVPAKKTVVAKPIAKPAAKPKVVKTPARPARKQTWAQKQRAALKARMAASNQTRPLVPVAKAPAAQLAPISPEELLRARAAYLAERQERYGIPSPMAPATSASAGNVQEGATVQPSSASRDILSLGGPRVITLVNQKQVPNPTGLKQVASRGNAAPRVAYRGGSPRDLARARAAAAKGQAGQKMANQALSYRGMPYRRGAASPSRGFDCSGLVYFLLRQRGYNPPRTAAGYGNYGSKVSKKDLKAGDLLLFANTYKRGISHIGVYMGDGKFVHAATSGTGVRVDSLGSGYYSAKYHSARRVP